MDRKAGIGAVLVSAAVVAAFILAGQDTAQSGDTRAGGLTQRVIEIESLKKDLELVDAMNKLALTREQTQALLDAARKVDALKQKFAAEHGRDLDQAADTMKELRSSMNQGKEAEDVKEEAELLRHRFERFQKKLDAEVEPIVDAVMEALKGVKGAEPQGDLLQEADAVMKIEQALDEIRFMSDEEYSSKIDPGIDQHLDRVGITDEAEREKEHARLREIADRTRTMAQEDYEGKAQDLAQEVLTKGATGAKVAAAKAGGLPKDARKNVKEVLLRDSTVGILEERLAAMKGK